MHIRAQNAAVIINKASDGYCFEAFELSPSNKAITKTKGRLRRFFPASAFVVSHEIYDEEGFQKAFSATVAKMSHQVAPDTRPKVKKAGQQHIEDRDTTHPRVVTDHLMSFLRTAGKPFHMQGVWKNTREEVLWLDTKGAWHRSPMWLLARVAIQLWFSRMATASDSPHYLYKSFMTFFLARILESVHTQALESDLLYAMNAKLARRLIKLSADEATPCIDAVRRVMSTINAVLESRWKLVMKITHPALDLSRLKTIKPKDDVDTQLPELDDFIAAITRRERIMSSCSFRPTFARPSYLDGDLPSVPNPSEDCDQTFALAAFESWIETNLCEWLDRYGAKATTCGKLRNLMESYHRSAAPYYSQNPEASSIMLLTILELWIACDKSACLIYAMLTDYEPEIPVELLQSICLPFKDQLARLATAERYLRNRQTQANQKEVSALGSFGHVSAFSVRYFDQSPGHQHLLLAIEFQARLDRTNKSRELSRKKEEYSTLMQLYDQGHCELGEYVDEYGNVGSYHKHDCERCQYNSRAQRITIAVHEWPLPCSQLEAKSVVFELRLPITFGDWRDSTTFLLDDVLGSEYSTQICPRAFHNLQNYGGLSSFLVKSLKNQRVGLLSKIKPHVKTHRAQKSIPDTTDTDVCVNNGLRFDYYDSTRGIFTSPFRSTDSVVNLCTYRLPDESSSLQGFLTRPHSRPSGPPPNTVIASQSDCPVHMSLDEFKAFCTVPLGCRLQWKNILIQLSAPSLDFAKVETSVLLLQTIYQVGPSNGFEIRRVSHQDLADEQFGHALLFQLSAALRRVKENWESSHALGSFINLATRLLSLSPSTEIQSKCLEYLKLARAVAFEWVVLIRNKVRDSMDDIHRTELRSKTIDVALVCVNTFNVDRQHLNSILVVPTEASTLLQCSITIQECLRSKLGQGDPLLSVMKERWKCLLFKALPMLTEQIVVRNSCCLDIAVGQCWSDYHPETSWQALASPYEHWLSSKTVAESDTGALSVHFNLLTAELLVNGRPLARLPTEYESHPMYATLFGRSVLEVMPTMVPGTEYSAKDSYAGYTIYFGMQSISGTTDSPASDLLVQAVRDGRRYDLLPSRFFRGRYPAAFADEYVHWYDHTDSSVEFRPIKTPWFSSPDNWRLTKAEISWRLLKGGAVLVSITKESAQALSDILGPLEDPSHIHTRFVDSSESLEIELPRLRLGFLLDSGASLIRSRQFRGMSVDSNQDIGTLTGLQNKLVLKADIGSHSRVVVIPEGHVTYQRTTDHMIVRVDKNTAHKVHRYRIDERLGRIEDNGDLQSKLFICYLHGLTSYCLEDPLTMKTGTEQALSILNSAAVRSFDRLAKDNLTILKRIASLAAGRAYYPDNERVMQTIHWDPNLTFLAQHSGLYKSVTAILEQAKPGKIFYPDTYIEPPDLDFIMPDLLERDLIRSSTFRVDGFGAEQHSLKHDVEYLPRDRYEGSDQATRSFVTASLIFQRQPVMHKLPNTGLRNHLWARLKEIGEIHGPLDALENSFLKFDSKWLKNANESLGPVWCRAHVSLGCMSQQYNRFEMMMWLSTMAFARDADMQVINTLAAFYNIPVAANISVPFVVKFNLSEGFQPSSSELRQIIRSTHLPFGNSRESHQPREAWESKQQAQTRKQREFKDNQKRAGDQFLSSLERQWPCQIPQTAIGNFELYLATDRAMNTVKQKFRTWFENRRFYEYLGDVENALVRQPTVNVPRHLPSFPVPKEHVHCKSRLFSVDDVFAAEISPPLLEAPCTFSSLVLTETEDTRSSSRLESLLSDIEAQTHKEFEKEYVQELHDSLRSLQCRTKTVRLDTQSCNVVQMLESYASDCHRRVQDLYSAMVQAIRNGSPIAHNMAAAVHQWPRVSPALFLEQLTRRRWNALTDAWQECIVRYGRALTELQRAERLCSLTGKPAELVDEFSNTGHQNWEPRKFPESLLLEVESGIMIRPVQEEIACRMRSPAIDRNAVMQLNMGEGKSTVIVPIVAAALADGTRLVRIIVGKPQSKQMFHMLLSKFGGMLGRRIFHMPFSRALRLEKSHADLIGGIYRNCMETGGVLLLQPEHILSFKLMGIESLITGRESIGRSLLNTQHFFDTNSRDIVDESDENFSVKFELIYTLGMQRPIELSPERWTITQKLLELTARFALELKHVFPLSLEVDDRWPGRFPIIRMLRVDAQETILRWVADHVCNIGFSGFPISRRSSNVR